MSARQPLRITDSILLSLAFPAASLALGVAGLYAFDVYRDTRGAAERLRAVTIAETYASQLATLLPRGDSFALEQWVGTTAYHRSLAGAAVIDAQGRLVSGHGDVELLQRYEASMRSEAGDDGDVVRIPGGGDGGAGTGVLVVRRPIRGLTGDVELGTLLVAVRESSDPRKAREAWASFAVLGLVANLGLAAGLFWVHRRVCVPLEKLARWAQLRPTRRGGDPPARSKHRDDEIGRLARAIQDMYDELQEWRGRAVRLEQTVDTRIAAETKKISRELRRAEDQAWTDPLTRLRNRRALEEKLDPIFQAQKAANQDFSIVMMDVDHFKTLNDTLGHSAGDALLSFVGELLRQYLREGDLAGRYGGDEFVLLLPGVALMDARALAQRTVNLFGQWSKLLDVRPVPTLSAGVASLGEHRPGDGKALMSLADRALYEAKRTGKGKVVCYRPEPVPAPARA